MHRIIEVIDRIQALPQTKGEWVAAAADTAGIVVTTIWLSGAKDTVDGTLHTAIAIVTLISVSFSLYGKVASKKKSK